MSNLEYDNEDLKPPSPSDGLDPIGNAPDAQNSAGQDIAEPLIAKGNPTGLVLTQESPSDVLAAEPQISSEKVAQAANNAFEKEAYAPPSPLSELKAETPSLDTIEEYRKRYELGKLLAQNGIQASDQVKTQGSSVPDVSLANIIEPSGKSGDPKPSLVLKAGLEERHYIDLGKELNLGTAKIAQAPFIPNAEIVSSETTTNEEQVAVTAKDSRQAQKNDTNTTELDVAAQVPSESTISSTDKTPAQETDSAPSKEDVKKQPPLEPLKALEPLLAPIIEESKHKVAQEPLISDAEIVLPKIYTNSDAAVRGVTVATEGLGEPAKTDHLPAVQLNNSPSETENRTESIASNEAVSETKKSVDDAENSSTPSENPVGIVKKHISDDGKVRIRLEIGAVENAVPPVEPAAKPNIIAMAPPSQDVVPSSQGSNLPPVPGAGTTGSHGPISHGPNSKTGTSESIAPPTPEKQGSDKQDSGKPPSDKQELDKPPISGEQSEKPSGKPSKQGPSPEDPPSGKKPPGIRIEGLGPVTFAPKPEDPGNEEPKSPPKENGAKPIKGVLAKAPDASIYLPNSILQEEAKQDLGSGKQADKPEQVYKKTDEPVTLAQAPATASVGKDISEPKQAQKEVVKESIVAKEPEQTKTSSPKPEAQAIAANVSVRDSEGEKAVATAQSHINIVRSDIGYLRGFSQMPNIDSVPTLEARIPQLRDMLSLLRNVEHDPVRKLVNEYESLFSQAYCAQKAFYSVKDHLALSLNSDSPRILEPVKVLKVEQSVQKPLLEYRDKSDRFEHQDMTRFLQKQALLGVLTHAQVNGYARDGALAQTAFRVLSKQEDSASDKAADKTLNRSHPAILLASTQLSGQTTPTLKVPANIDLKDISKPDTKLSEILGSKGSKVASDEPTNKEARVTKELSPEQKALSVPSTGKNFGDQIQDTIRQIFLALKEKKESDAYKERHNFRERENILLSSGAQNAVVTPFVVQAMRRTFVRNTGDSAIASRVVVPLPSIAVRKTLASLNDLSHKSKDHSRLAMQMSLGFLGAASSNNVTEEQQLEAIARSTNLYASAHVTTGLKLQSEIGAENDKSTSGGATTSNAVGIVANSGMQGSSGNLPGSSKKDDEFDETDSQERLVRASYT